MLEKTYISPQVVYRHVTDGEYIFKKNMKGSRAWDQFRVVLNPSNNEEVFGVACCCVYMVRMYPLQKKGEQGGNVVFGYKTRKNC